MHPVGGEAFSRFLGMQLSPRTCSWKLLLCEGAHKMKRVSSWAAGLAGLLGVVAAVLLMTAGQRLAGKGTVPSVKLDDAAKIRMRQIRAAAAGNARGVQVKAARFTGLEEEEEEAAEDSGEAANFTECNSWRGCYMMREQYDINGTTEILPEQVQFECGGEASTEICYNATMACLDSAESFSAMLYKVSPFEGSEMRTKSSCKCFSSNGCRPSCNVVLYQRWSANTGINCPAQPPKFHEESGVYQYGNPQAEYVSPEDYSFDYYPEYPNPAGHVYDSPWARNTYEAEPGIGFYQTPLLARYGGDDVIDGSNRYITLAGQQNPMNIRDARNKFTRDKAEKGYISKADLDASFADFSLPE